MKTLLRSTRPSFLILAPICVLLGLATSLNTHHPLNFLLLFLIMLGAVSAHVSVNTFNEFADFKSGLDLNTIKTPFSGGSGALPESPEMADSVLMIAALSLLLTIIIGIYLVSFRGWVILPIGMAGVLLIVAYTPWINRLPWLCLIAPGLGFGPLMVVGTHAMLSGEMTFLPWVISLVPFFLTNNLLLLNQYPDLDADAQAGRKTFPIVFGLRASNWVYAIFMGAAYLLILILIFLQLLPALAVIALLPMVCSVFALIGANKYGSELGSHPQFLVANVMATLLTPFLLGFVIIFG